MSSEAVKNVSDSVAGCACDYDLNTPDERGDVPLHKAIINNDLKMLDQLLRQCHIDVNYKNYKGESPLLLSLRLVRDPAFVMHLVELGCDLNITNNFGQTPLHVAILCTSTDIAHKLIVRGTNVDAQDKDQRTALHYAVENDNLEAVCMLLYHGADVSITCKNRMTPLAVALYHNKLDIAEALFNYYDDFSSEDIDGYTALHFAAQQGNPMAISLVNAGADVNCVTNFGESPIVDSLKFEDAELFKLLWSKLDPDVLLNYGVSFLQIYLETANFAAEEWLECLYLMLGSPLALTVLESGMYGGDILLKLLYALAELEVEIEDRSAIINICLSLGIEVNLQHVSFAWRTWGYGEELETLMYFVNDCKLTDLPKDGIFPLLPFLCAVNEDLSSQAVFKLVQDQILTLSNSHNVLDVLGYFAMSSIEKQDLHCLCCTYSMKDTEQIVDRLESIPEVPSLVELSRNQTRWFIRQTYSIKKPYQFQDAVKNLNIPKYIKDLICFKVPVYK